MAKAKEIKGLDCAADALAWAAEVLHVRFAEIVNLRGAALNSDDIEGVHAMRVATRRLRSALRDFAPLMRRRPLKKIRKDLKRLADTLGAARDEDVRIAALEKLLAKAEDERIKDGIEKLIEERRRRRAQAQLDLMETLAVSSFENLQERFTSALSAAAQPKKSAPSLTFSEAGRAAAAASLEEFCALSTALYAPFEIERLHRLRIAAKRLRYAIELFVACWGERIAPFAAGIAEMQSFLGEVHDADVWIENLGKDLREKGDSTAANIWLLSEFTRYRTKNYRLALELWSKWQTERFTENLRELLST